MKRSFDGLQGSATERHGKYGEIWVFVTPSNAPYRDRSFLLADGAMIHCSPRPLKADWDKLTEDEKSFIAEWLTPL